MHNEDVTAQLNGLKRRLEQARLEAAENARIRDDFLARISHELRTPLNVIMGMTELLADTRLDMSQSSYLSMISQASIQLQRLVNEVLDFSQLLTGLDNEEQVDFLISDEILPRLQPLEKVAHEKGVHFFTHVASEVTSAVRGIPSWIAQVVIALVDNAVKFTDYGEVLVQFAGGRDANGKPILCFSVTDTGIGVPKESQDVIFNKLVTGPHSGRYAGLGMGLAVARELVNKLGGEIRVDSELYLGSTFYVTLPLSRVAPRVAAPCVPEGPFRILLAEDEPVNQFMTVQLLSKHGHRIAAVDNGLEALDALAGQKFDLVLMDISMPVMDGLEATQLIRSGEIPEIDRNIPIIALTAMALPVDRQRCIAAGVNAFVTKPVETARLEEMMRDVLASQCRQ